MQCPYCTENIDEKSINCPYCRRKIRTDKTGQTINIILIVAIILLLVAIAAFFRFIVAAS